eukprot:31832_2
MIHQNYVRRWICFAKTSKVPKSGGTCCCVLDHSSPHHASGNRRHSRKRCQPGSSFTLVLLNSHFFSPLRSQLPLCEWSCRYEPLDGSKDTVQCSAEMRESVAWRQFDLLRPRLKQRSVSSSKGCRE